MADEKEKAAPAPKGGGGGVLGLLLPAVIAGAAAFGGAKVAGAQHNAAPASSEQQQEPAKPPGPTLALEPFLLTVPDVNKKAHPMKVTLAVEFEGTGGKEKEEEGFKTLVPRIRDSTLNFLRTTSFEEALDPAASDKMRTEILERIRTSGVPTAQHVLITDLVIQ